MARRLYTKVSPALWTSRRFRALGHEARLFYLYLLTNEHIDSTGCYRLPAGYACADFGITPGEFDSLSDELANAGLIAIDPEAEYVRILRWFRHNPPMNRDHLAGTRDRINQIESDTLRGECETDFLEAEADLERRLVAIEAAKVDRAEKARLRVVPHSGHSPSDDRLANTRYMRGGVR